MPFVFDLAAARGYKTAFITSSTLRWANFESFFRGASIDQLITAETFQAPFINDLTVDDHLAYAAASNVVRETSEPLFIGLYVNALHWPFQAESKAEIPSSITNRRLRAAFVHERGFEQLFAALRETDRLENALIIVVGDHGEFDFSDLSINPIMRVETFTNGILSPIFLMKMPDQLPAPLKEAAAENVGKLVATQDIAPTLAHILGISLEDGLEYSGHSLFQTVPDDRIVRSTATNEWRSWLRGSVAVSQGRQRLLCEPQLSCRRYVSVQGDLVYLRDADIGDALLTDALASPIMRAAILQSIMPRQ
jgi:phosphoglycerol transferase MdoB-like AlkP superfamily enzyme